MTFAEIPLLRLAIPFILGVIAAFEVRQCLSFPLLIFLFSLTFVFLLSSFLLRNLLIRVKIQSVLVTMMMLVSGTLIMFVHDGRNAATFWTKRGEGCYIVRVGEPKEKGKWKKATCEVIKDSKGNSVRGKAMVYFPPEEKISYGDVCLIELKSIPISKVPDPGSFDYAAVLEKKNVHSTIFLRNGEYKKLEDTKVGVSEIIYKWRTFLLDKIDRCELKSENKALLASLVLGYTADLDEETKEAFYRSGTLHVLAVSGLHVGLIYLLLLRFFKLIRIRAGWKYALIILLVWLYAGLTGFSPSVLRASVVCSFILIGEATRRISNSMNALAGSAILLLAIDPFMVFDIGFQLSYLAVSGIILFQPMFLKFPAPNLWFFRELRSMVGVTLAAQLGTAGISLLYFGNFPVYFIPANLLIVPASSLLLYAGLIYFASLPFDSFRSFLSPVLDAGFDWFQLLVKVFAELPGALMTNLKLGSEEMMFCYAVLLSAYIFLPEKRWSFFRLLMVFGFLYSLICIYDRKEMNSRRSVSFLNDGQILICDGRREIRLNSDSSVTTAHCFKNSDVIRLVDRTFLLNSDRKPANTEVLVINSGNCKHFESLLSMDFCKEILIDGTVSFNRSRMIKEHCEDLGLKCWSVKIQGAYSFSLD